MVELQQILKNVTILSKVGDVSLVNDLQLNSRKVSSGSCFIALKGSTTDGHLHINKAIENGAIVIVCQEIPVSGVDKVCYVIVENSSIAAGIIAHNFYGNPSEVLKLVGVTGTNGKTTIATLLFKLFTALGYKCGLISTVQNQVGDDIIPSTHTTPDAISLNSLLAGMVQEKCTHVFMEVSSHALDQNRVAGLRFTGGVFSNITHDHLDYHKTFDEYIKAKKKFFDALPAGTFSISNLDDKRGVIMLQNSQAKKYYYSLRTMADFKGKIIENNITGLVMTINDIEVHFRMIGSFNAYNLLAVYGVAICMGEDKLTVLQLLSSLEGAEGRFDYMISTKEKVIGIVDYAHTPDALLNILATIKNLRQGHELIFTVVGCGGDRDKTKRPIMAEVACEHSNKIIFTSDNPRSEDPLQIIRDMESGVNVSCKKKYISIADRKEAIKTAVSLSKTEDIVLVAGKGHEKYQEIKGVKYPFDDKAVLMEMFELLDK